MTALGALDKVDADRIRQAYESVMNPCHADEETRAHLAGVLRGYMWLLLPGVQDRLRRDLPAGFDRSTVYQVIFATWGVLAQPVRGGSSPAYVYDLATLARSLLALHQHPT